MIRLCIAFTQPKRRTPTINRQSSYCLHWLLRPRDGCKVHVLWWVCLSICLSVRSHNSKTTRWINGSKVLIRNSLSRQTYTAKACLLKPKFHGSSFLAASSWFLFTRMLATNLFSLSVCRVVLQIPRARHARTVADMLATRHTILTRWDGLKIARILVTFATRIL